jgi:SAM-dependent methyltransferase
MSLDQGYFDGMYAASADPWEFASRWYEARKYAISLALLPREHYGHAFEPGCSIGVLTALLAARCDQLLACDVAAAAVDSAARRTAPLGHVRVERRDILRDWPPGTFDLIVFSEVLYYYAGEDLNRVLGQAAAALRPDGNLLAVHWRHPVTDYPRSGDEVHLILAGHPGLARLVEHREPDFVAEVYTRAGGRLVSVAEAGGLV